MESLRKRIRFSELGTETSSLVSLVMDLGEEEEESLVRLQRVGKRWRRHEE